MSLKKIKTMKKIKLALVLIFILNITQQLLAQTVTIDGFTYLENQVNSNNVQIVFKRVAPSVLYDTTYTDNNGYFNRVIPQGIYNVYYSKSGYISDSLISQTLYSNTTLSSITLYEVGLQGQLSGIIFPGTYKVGGNIEVANGDTLIIEPGVSLKFVYNTDFTINGLLFASGTVADSIYFTSYNDSTWKGIRINNIANDNTIISYAVVEHSNDKGIELYNSNPTLVNLNIRNNTAYPTNDQYNSLGGGIYVNNSHPILKDIIFENNYAFFGSAIHSQQSSFSIENCIIRNHLSYTGASVFLENNSSVEIVNTIITNSSITNWTLAGPTAVRCGYSTLILRNSIIANNQYGGVSGYYSYIKSINSLFHNNNGYDQAWPGYVGAGIVIENSEINIINSIFSNHTLYGIGNYGINTINVNHSCFWNNNASYMHLPVNFIGTIVTVNMNGDSCDAYLNIFENPLFADTVNMDFTLNNNSPCIDAGINDSIYFNTDMLENVRIFDGNNDSVTIVDIGTYEYGAPLYMSSSVSNNFQTQFEYKIYPNPSNGYITVENSKKTEINVIVTDIIGKPIIKKTLYNKSNELNLSSLSNGMYFITINNNNEINTIPIIILKN